MKPSAQDYLNRIRLDEVISTIRILSRRNEHPESPPRNGGVLSITVVAVSDVATTSLAATSVGNPGGKIHTYAFNAHEKLRRLYTRRKVGKEDVAASQSADNENVFGGAIYFLASNADVYISLSGAPPKVDEAIAFVLGEKLGLTGPKEYRNVLLDDARELLAHVILPYIDP